MNYTVVWLAEAERRLTEVWLRYPAARSAIAAASHRIDTQLARDPVGVGESRPGGRRILFEPPLGVLYRLDPIARAVRVITVWYFVQRRPRQST